MTFSPTTELFSAASAPASAPSVPLYTQDNLASVLNALVDAVNQLAVQGQQTPQLVAAVRGLQTQVANVSSVADGKIDGARLIANSVPAQAILNGSITDTQIANAAITAAQLANSSVTAPALANGAVLAQNLADNAVTFNKLAANSIDSTKFATGQAPIGVGGTLPNPVGYSGPLAFFLTTDQKLYRYNANAVAWTRAVDGSDVVANSITAGALAVGAVTATAIAAGAVTTQALAAGSVTAGVVAAGAIGTAKLDAAAVEAVNIAAGAVTADKLAVGAVTANSIAAAAINANALAAGAVTANSIAAGAVTANALAAGAVTTGAIFGAAVGTAQLADGAVVQSKLDTAVIAKTFSPGYNFINNPSAANGSLAGWSAVGPAFFYYGGWTMGSVFALGGGTDGQHSFTNYIAPVPDSGQAWCFSVSAAGATNTGSYCYLEIVALPSETILHDSQTLAGAFSVNNQQFFVTGVAPAGTTSIECRVVVYGSIPNNVVYWNAKLEQGSAPSLYTADSQLALAASVATQAKTSVDALTGKVNASYTLAVDANGYSTGFIAQTNGTQSSFKIRTDDFEISPSSTVGVAYTQFSSGSWKVYDAAGTLRIQLGVW